MAKIIFINRYFYPDHSATSQLLTDLAFSLAREGSEVHVVTSRQRYDDPGARLIAEETTADVRIYRLRATTFGRASLSGRAVDYATFYLGVAWRLFILARAGDLVVAKTDPPLISVVAMIVAVLRRAILVNWVQDLFPEVAEALGVKAVCAVAAPLRWLRNASLRAANNNVVLGELMAERLRGKGIRAEAVTIIPNWSDASAIYPVAPQDNPLRSDWHLNGKFVVGYSGNMGRAHEFNTLIETAQCLRDESRIVFVFIGGGAHRKALEEEVSRRGLKNIQFQPYQPRERLALSLSVPDLHVISLFPQLEGLIVPSKFYGIAAAGRPTLFIGDPHGEIPRILADHKCGNAVAVGDVESAVRCIRILSEKKGLLEQQGRNARRAFEEVFSQSRAINAWRRLLSVYPNSACP